MVVSPVSRVLDPLSALIVSVAVIVSALWLDPPRQPPAIRAAAVAVELRAAAVETALAGVAAVTAAEAEAAGVEQPVSASQDPVDLIGGAVTLAAAVAGAALWYAAFPITLPASIVAGMYFATVLYVLNPAKIDPIPDGIRWGVTVFFEFPPAAVKYAIDSLQPVQPVQPVSAAAAAVGGPRPAAAPVPPTSVPAQTATPESAAPGASGPEPSGPERSLRATRARAASQSGTAPDSRPSGPRRPASARAVAAPAPAAGGASGSKADSVPGTARHAARGAR